MDMPGRSVTARSSGPLPLLASLLFSCLAPALAPMARAQDEPRSLVPVASLPPLESITRERVRDHAVIRTAEESDSQPREGSAHAGASVATSNDASSLDADAGDDQIGLVGR